MTVNAKRELDRTGMIVFLLLTYSTTYAIVYLYYLKGVTLGYKHPYYGSIPLAFSMLIPGLAGWVVREYVTKSSSMYEGIHLGPIRHYAQAYFFIPALYLVALVLTALFVAPFNAHAVYMGQGPDGRVSAGIISFVFISIFPALLTGPLIAALHSFGQEYGWRGYCLYNFAALGKRKAILYSSLLWGLWYAPYVFLKMYYMENTLLGAVEYFFVISLFGIYLGYLRFLSGGVVLPAFAHGIFIVHFYGVWNGFFPHMNIYLGGMPGLVGIVTLLGVAIWVMTKGVERLEKQDREKPEIAEGADVLD